jgi:hypothetical protein
MDLEVFGQEVRRRADRWTGLGITANFKPPSDEARQRSKWSATADLDSTDAAGELTIWTSGEAEMTVAYLSDGAMQLVHYDLTEAELGACLDDFIELMLHRPPDDQLHPPPESG